MKLSTGAAYLLMMGSAASFLGNCGNAGHTEFNPNEAASGAGGSGQSSTSSTGTGRTTVGGSLNLGTGGYAIADAGPPRACVGLGCERAGCTAGPCKQKPCEGATRTTISGYVYDPAGKVPLYNVIVYVPNGPVAPFTPGATCDRCSTSAINAAASALTDTKGHFVIDDAPIGAKIPLVVQVGKWRRQLEIANVPRCVETAIADKELTRLPRNKAEGNIPLIAITTGGADSMECLPLRMGIDPKEFTNASGNGRIHLFKGHDNPPQTATGAFDATGGSTVLTDATTLWNDVNALKKYDMVILSCEGEIYEETKPMTARQALYDYESLGGRVFASHWHHIWFSGGPQPVPTIGNWQHGPNPIDPIDATVNVSFPKGKALSEWLVTVGASMTPGTLQIQKARDDIDSVNPAAATEWISLENTRVGNVAEQHTVEFLSFNAPIGVPEEQQCGRAVFNDMHVSESTGDTPGGAYPGSCMPGDLSNQEKVLEFLLFDLSSCVRRDDQPPVPPVVN
ncbi:MAG TPA: carboxypeptidase regulatory-like domain-containing protein [Polyangiaceae bacterium]|nr:carboxypeptidase regulatory-like domain-containing protein [Polyangiaceae bacterium]